jgi:hypothetical protein
MMPHPLALSDNQIGIIRRSARPLPVAFRGRFLELVADRLLDLDVLTDADIEAAVRTVLQLMFGGRAA